MERADSPGLQMSSGNRTWGPLEMHVRAWHLVQDIGVISTVSAIHRRNEVYVPVIDLLGVVLRVDIWRAEDGRQEFHATRSWRIPIYVIALISILGCGVVLPGNEVPNRIEQLAERSSGQSSPKFTPGELYEIADIVAVGSPTDHRVVQKLAALSPTYPDDLRGADANLVVEVRIFSFTVESYIKGEGADVIEILTDAGAERAILEEGNSYMLYLYQPLDKAFWEYTHRVHGAQGVWRIAEGDAGQDIARQELLPGGKEVLLQDLIGSRTGSRRSASFRQRWEARVAEWGD